jgi:hypothetical protein
MYVLFLAKKLREYDKICMLVFRYSAGYSCQVLMKLRFFERPSNINAAKIRPVGAEFFYSVVIMKLIA